MYADASNVEARVCGTGLYMPFRHAYFVIFPDCCRGAWPSLTDHVQRSYVSEGEALGDVQVCTCSDTEQLVFALVVSTRCGQQTFPFTVP